MSEPLLVEVTEKHIEHAEGGAHALLRALVDKGFPNPSVGVTTVWVDGIFGDRFAALPQEFHKFRNAIANGLPVKPITFALDVKEVEGVHRHREEPCSCEPDDDDVLIGDDPFQTVKHPAPPREAGDLPEVRS